MQRSTFKVLFCLKRQSENPIRFPSWVVSPSTARCRSSATNSPFVPPSGMPRLKASGRSLEAQRLNEKLENIKTNIGKLYQRLCDRDLYVTAEKVRNAFLGMGDDCRLCCKPSTNTLQASSNVWAKTAPIPPMRITACGAGVLQLCTNTNTMSRTFRSKS